MPLRIQRAETLNFETVNNSIVFAKTIHHLKPTAMKNLQSLSEAITLGFYLAMTVGGSTLIVYGIYQFARTILPVLTETAQPF